MLTNGWSLYGFIKTETGFSEPLLVATDISTPCITIDFFSQHKFEKYEFRKDLVEYGQYIIDFLGIAGLATVYINGAQVIESDSMFSRNWIVYTFLGKTRISLFVESLKDNIQFPKKPRQLWRQNLTKNTNLRNVRQTFLGEMPGWCPEDQIIGPFKPIVCLLTSSINVVDYRISYKKDATTDFFICKVAFSTTKGQNFFLYQMFCEIDGFTEKCIKVGDSDYLNMYEAQVSLPLEETDLWHPHNVGEQPLFQINLLSDKVSEPYKLATIGFREVMNEDSGSLAIHVNGRKIFCRGANWTSLLFKKDRSFEDYNHLLTLAKNAGINMLRISGITSYENDIFYELCDKLGIMVWQDVMLANFDYPMTEKFISDISTEVNQLCSRISHHPCVVVICGGSEVYQQASMVGLSQEPKSFEIFKKIIPQLIDSGSFVYIENTPFGGEVPFSTRHGVTHYYGVGAYLRDFSDIRRSDVKFASECLALSNIPSEISLQKMGMPPVHHPAWKMVVPRDNNVSWDFEDVRDFYLELLYGEKPNILRYEDRERYLKLSRAVSFTLMVETFSEWRSSHSACNGGLVWQFQDLSLGAGWGVIDSQGVPKAAYYGLQRVFASRQVLITDEGLNGLDFHIINENGPAELKLVVTSWRGKNIVAQGTRKIECSGGMQYTVNSNELYGAFFDICYAYRFGSLSHDVTFAELFINEERISITSHMPKRQLATVLKDEGIFDAKLEYQSGKWYVEISTMSFCHLIHIEGENCFTKENWIDLPPATKWKTEIIPLVKDFSPIMTIAALNSKTRKHMADVK